MILNRLAEELQELAVVEQRPQQDGRNMTMMLAPQRAGAARSDSALLEPNAPRRRQAGRRGKRMGKCAAGRRPVAPLAAAAFGRKAQSGERPPLACVARSWLGWLVTEGSSPGRGSLTAGPRERPSCPVGRGLRSLLRWRGLSLAVAVAPGLAGKTGPNNTNAKQCQKGGWESLTTDTGGSFANEQACVSYAAQGGALVNPLALCKQALPPPPASPHPRRPTTSSAHQGMTSSTAGRRVSTCTAGSAATTL